MAQYCGACFRSLAWRAQDAALNLADPDVAAIAKLADDFAHAVDGGDLNRIVDLYSVANRRRKTIGANRARMAIRVEDVDVSGDLAYDRISCTMTNSSSGDE
jgi:hypothetical protein